MRITRSPWLVYIGLPLVVGLSLLGWGRSAVEAQSSIATLGIDMDVTGNAPRTEVGVNTTRQECVRVNQGQAIQIDVFVDEIPADRGVSGFQLEMIFDPGLVTVTASDFFQLLDEAHRSDVFIAGDTTSSDGSYNPGVFDFGPLGIEPDGASEIGPGILVRITVTGQAGTAVGDLVLQSVFVQDDVNQGISVTAILPAKVAVNTDCPPVDSDGDGFTDVAEGDIGTGALDPCGNDGWPADLQANNRLDIGDMNSFLFPLRGDGSFNKFDHPVPDPQDLGIERWNLQVDAEINIGDLNALNPAVDAPTSRPPMFGGAPALFTDVGNGVGVCPFPP